jgi:hypothetical protein
VHPRHAGQAVIATGERQGCGQRSESRAGVAEKQIGRTHREIPRHTRNTERLARPRSDANAEGLQCFEHARGVVGEQQLAKLGLACRQRRQQQQAVGEALRTRQAYRTARRE